LTPATSAATVTSDLSNWGSRGMVSRGWPYRREGRREYERRGEGGGEGRGGQGLQ